MPRIALGVVIGFIAWTAIWLAANFAIAAAGGLTDQGQVAAPWALPVALVVSVAASAVSGLVAGRLARRSVVTTGVLLGILLLLVGIGVQVSNWDAMPLWYHLSFLILLVPATVAGARLAGPKPGPVAATPTR